MKYRTDVMLFTALHVLPVLITMWSPEPGWLDCQLHQPVGVLHVPVVVPSQKTSLLVAGGP